RSVVDVYVSRAASGFNRISSEVRRENSFGVRAKRERRFLHQRTREHRVYQRKTLANHRSKHKRIRSRSIQLQGGSTSRYCIFLDATFKSVRALYQPMRLQSISLRQPLSFVCWLLLFSLDPGPISIAQVEAPVAPYPTGTHLQLVRQFYGSAHGLPADDIQAV